MREESHLEDMRSALRGDFERLAERRGSQDLMRRPDDAVEPEPEMELQPEVVPEEPEPDVVPEGPPAEADPEPAAVADVEPAPDPEPDPGPDPGPAQPEDRDEPEEPPRRSFLDRLFGR